MAQYVVDGEKLTAIADAIRAKTGGTENLTLDQMPTEIEGIESGGSQEITLQNKTITENGTYAADSGYDGLGQVVVNVSEPSEGVNIDTLIDRSLTEISSNVTNIGQYAFYYCTALANVNLPLATSLGNYALGKCTALTAIDLPLVTSIGTHAFYDCTNLLTANFPSATTINSYAFRGCTKLTTANFPSATSTGSQTFYVCYKLANVNFPLATSVGADAFYSCYVLESADFPLVTSIAKNAFCNCYKLTKLILRSETMCTLADTTAFTKCYHILGTTHSSYNPNGNTDGYIYVPRALVDTYKADSVWSTFATQFRALEDYTVDGTTTGALDESKI